MASGEGKRIDAYLQLKTCPSERLRGKILIDSPGFDADAQRTATLRITDHIIDLSDLVLVFFDARHPEPGAMRDTLQAPGRRHHQPRRLGQVPLYPQSDRHRPPARTIRRTWSPPGSGRSARQGLTAGRFYTIYSPDAATPIADEHRRKRFETKRDEDLGEIHGRMEKVEIERAYRIVAALRKTATDFSRRARCPCCRRAVRRWRRRTLLADAGLWSPWSRASWPGA